MLDPSPPRRLDRSGSRCSSTASPETSSARLSTRRSPAPSSRHAACSAPTELARGLAAVRSAGDHYFSAAWLDELHAVGARTVRGPCDASPLDPGIAARRAPARPSRGRRRAEPARDRAARREGLPPRRDGRARRACARRPRELEAGSRSEEIVEGRRHASSRRSSRSGGRCGASATASRCRRRCTSAGARLLATLDPITLAAFRDALGVGRRTAQLLLERFDADGLTLRRGDIRFLRRRRD